MSVFKLETERLVLRVFDRGDVEPLQRVLGDPDTMTYYPAPFTIEQTIAWIDRNIHSHELFGHALWAMVHKDSGEMVGDCGLTIQKVEGRYELEVGWHTRRDLWGQGLATEAAQRCIGYAFDDLDFDKVIALVRPENQASCAVAEKLGLAVEAETTRANWLHRVYALTRPGF